MALVISSPSLYRCWIAVSHLKWWHFRALFCFPLLYVSPCFVTPTGAVQSFRRVYWNGGLLCGPVSPPPFRLSFVANFSVLFVKLYISTWRPTLWSFVIVTSLSLLPTVVRFSLSCTQSHLGLLILVVVQVYIYMYIFPCYLCLSPTLQFVVCMNIAVNSLTFRTFFVFFSVFPLRFASLFCLSFFCFLCSRSRTVLLERFRVSRLTLCSSGVPRALATPEGSPVVAHGPLPWPGVHDHRRVRSRVPPVRTHRGEQEGIGRVSSSSSHRRTRGEFFVVVAILLFIFILFVFYTVGSLEELLGMYVRVLRYFTFLTP